MNRKYWELILSGILIFFLYLDVNFGVKYLPNFSTGNSSLDWIGISIIPTILISVIALAMNFRKVFLYSSVGLLIIFFAHLFSNGWGTNFNDFRTTRNIVFTILASYLFFHIIVHGVSKLLKKKRKLLTKEGVLVFVLIMIITTFTGFLY